MIVFRFYGLVISQGIAQMPQERHGLYDSADVDSFILFLIVYLLQERRIIIRKIGK